jgi:hypothetical protein
MSSKRSHSPDNEKTLSSSIEATKYFKSGTIEDRNSTFVALFSPAISAKELQRLPEFKTASHRMAAWRKPSTQRTLTVNPTSPANPIYVTGSDDDGEKYGGKRLEKVLNELNVEGAVMVARWYGGVLLGPVRFTHIENAAREAMLLWKNSTSTPSKKRKTEDSPSTDVQPKERLIRNLEERDRSIAVLRQLLAEKSETRSQQDVLKGTKSSQGGASPSKPLDYASMPVQRLSQLEKARDATIAWILKQIDTVEAKAA